MRRHDDLELLTTREAFSLLRVDELKPLAALVGQVPTRKGALVDLLARALEDREGIRTLYAGLDDLGQKAVQKAVHDDKGILHGKRFPLCALLSQFFSTRVHSFLLEAIDSEYSDYLDLEVSSSRHVRLKEALVSRIDAWNGLSMMGRGQSELRRSEG